MVCRLLISLHVVAFVAGMALTNAALAQQQTEPSVVLQLSPEGVRSLNQEFDDDFRSLDAFGGQRKDRFLRSIPAQPKHWQFYGRLGLLNFQNELKDDSGGTRWSFRRSGPKLTGKVYVGIHRRF